MSPRIVWIDTICEYPIYGELVDTRLYNSNYDISLPLAAVYLKSYVDHLRPGSTFVYHPRRLYQAQGRRDALTELVQDGDIVLTSCSTADAPDAQRILTAAKAAGRTTVIGGIYARFCASDILEWGTADYICTGEGEQALVHILDEITGAAEPGPFPGVVTPACPHRGSARLIDLADLPDPDFGSFPIADFAPYMNSAYILATRGCPAPCHFCTSARLYGFSYRMRPVDSVLRELAQLYDLGFRKITLADDTVLVDHEWASALFGDMARRNPGYRLKVRARADELSASMMDRMVDAGVEVVQFGVENIQLSTRSSMHKRLEQRAIEKAFDIVLGKPGVLANPLYMLAYPGESWADCEANAAFIKSAGSDKRVLTYLSFTTPYPGTGFAKSIAKVGGAVLTKKLKYYTNKFPVFIPASMFDDGVEAALKRLVDCYDDIATCVNRSFAVQRPIPRQFFADIDVTFVGRADDRR
jgi:radical SAM superfamily enzyme YgiQ (UPF0313 family)